MVVTRSSTRGRAARWSSLATEKELERRVRDFRRSITPDVYSVESFVPWSEIEEQLESYAEPIAALQHLVDESRLSTRYLGQALREEPEIATVARILFTAPHAVGFADGRELPEWYDPEISSSQNLARLLIDAGLQRLLPPGAQVADLYRIALVAVDARRRGF